jgi:alanyl-tRNA synthetase
MTAADIRASFLDSFARHGHRIVASASLVPANDPTLLFTNAGMNQFKDVFLGKETRSYTRATTAQKCMRVSGKHNDLHNVGPSFRHHTFFEMLGNFSFGDYFKEEAISLAWTLLTKEWQLPVNRLHATVFKGEAGVPRDDAAFELWRAFLPADRIGELGAADNFWQMGDTGPCGRCSEIYYFRGADLPCAAEAAGGRCRGLECDCDRFIEIWNNVFMEFDRQPDGTLAPLPAPSIDTGMGLERVTAVMQGHLSNYDTDLFTPILQAIGARAARVHRGTSEPADVSMRVVADHLRSMTFLIADGVVPSNEWRGYVLRKIMRRAMRHGRRLGIEEPFLHALVDTVVGEFGQAYPELTANRDAVIRVVHSEEERFGTVLAGGLPRLEDALDRAASVGDVLPGEMAFRLYDTFGLPRDFIEDMAEDRHLRFDVEGFDAAMAGQREQARAKSAFKGRAAGADVSWTAVPATQQALAGIGEQVFRGYDTTRVDTQVVALFAEDRTEVASLTAGAHGFVALEETPFYLEAGGQVSDTGTITGPRGAALVTAVVRVAGWPRLHAVDVQDGAVGAGDAVTAAVTDSVRDATRRNHTATHLLHAALRQVLGGHVKQAGSLVSPDRLRFDFAHFSALTRAELSEVEHIVNAQVLGNSPVFTEVKRTEEAIAGGAMALFGEKYGETVRVVSVPGFSTELCGGTHVRATGDIGPFLITSEGGVAAGVRRIEAITGLGALATVMRYRDEAAEIGATVGAAPGQLAERIVALHDENKRLARELQHTKVKLALGGGAAGGDEAVEVAGVKLVARQVDGVDKDTLRALVDQHRDRIKSGVVVLASPADGKVLIVVGVTADLVKTVPAGQVVKRLAPIVGGGGGGRADFAEAGGKDPQKIAEMLAASREVVAGLLSGARA